MSGEHYRFSAHHIYSSSQAGLPPEEETYHDEDNYWDGWYDLWLGGRAEYHRPFGTRWQLDYFGAALVPMFPDYGPGLNVQNELRTTMLITDRWRGDLLLRQQRYLYRDRGGDWWKTTAAVGLRYYIEDHLSMSISAEQSQGMRVVMGQEPEPGYYLGYSPPSVFPYYPIYQRVYQINVGLSYHFMGALDTFGLVPQVSLMR
jgi:hypothetical protein